MNKEPLVKAIAELGSQKALAEAIREMIPGSRVKQGHIGNWLRKNKVLPPQYAAVIEKITSKKVLRNEWAPICYVE